MKKRVLMFLIVGLALATMGIAATASAATILANVAAFKPTEGTDPGYGYPPEMGNDDSRYFTFSHGDTTNDSYWQVDLGETFTIDHVTINCRHDGFGVYFGRTNTATLQGYADNGGVPGDPVGPAIVLLGYSDTVDRLSWDNSEAGWTGVRFFKVGGPGLAPQYLHVGEFQAFAEVETYPDFITGITVTATESYPGLGVTVDSLVNNRGMDDQGVGIGDPDALHEAVWGDGCWHSDYNPATDPVLTFDLGKTYDLTDMVIWNEHQESGRCIANCLIEHSTNGTDYTELEDTNGGEEGNYTLTPYDDVEETPPWPHSDAIDLGAEEVDARYIRLTAYSAWGDGLDERNYCGLSEVRFYGEQISVEEIPGDATEDGNVNSLDAERLATFWGATELEDGYTWWQMGDFNKDFTIGPADAAIMAANWGYGPGEAEAGSPVPEPSTLVLLGSLLALGLLKRRVF